MKQTKRLTPKQESFCIHYTTIGAETFGNGTKSAILDRQRDEVVKAAFDTLTQSLTKAVENLVGLIDNKDDRLKRLACKDVIDFIIRHKENEDLDRRLTEVEKRLAE